MIIGKFKTLGKIEIYIDFASGAKSSWTGLPLKDVYHINKKGNDRIPKRNPEPYTSWIYNKLKELTEKIEKETKEKVIFGKYNEQVYVSTIKRMRKPTLKTSGLLTDINMRKTGKYLIKNPIIRAIHETQKKTRLIKAEDISVKNGYFLIDYNGAKRQFGSISVEYKLYEDKYDNSTFIHLMQHELLEKFATEYLDYTRKTITDGIKLKSLAPSTIETRKKKRLKLPIFSYTTPLFATGELHDKMQCVIKYDKKTIIVA